MAENKEEEIREILYDTEALKRKSVTGFSWTLIQMAGSRAISFTVTVLLARFLSPEDYGVLATVTILTEIVRFFADAGFGSSLARTEKLEQEDLSTIFYFNLFACTLCYLVVFIGAPFVADFFHSPQLVAFIRVQGLTLYLAAFSNIQGVLIWRDMNFRARTIINMGASVVGGIVGCTTAYLGYGPWALIWQAMSSGMWVLLANWYVSWWRPKLIFSVPHLKKHFSFGLRLTLLNIFNVLYGRLSTILVARFFSQRDLGIYGQAGAFQNVPIGILSEPINQVTYPIFVRIQNDIERLKSGYRRAQRILFQMSTPVMLTLIVLAEPLYLFMFGAKWVDAIPIFRVLCVNGILYPLNSYNTSVVQLKGRMDLAIRMDVARKIVNLITLLVGLWYGGILGLAWGGVVAQVFNLVINSYYSGELLHFPLKEQLGELLPLFLTGLASGACVWAVDYVIASEWLHFFRLALGGIVMALSTLALQWIFFRDDVLYIWDYLYHHVLKRP